MSSTAVAIIAMVALAVVIGVVIRARAHRALTAEEIAQLVNRIHSQTGVDPTKPQGFTVQADGTWVPIQRDEAEQAPPPR